MWKPIECSLISIRNICHCHVWFFVFIWIFGIKCAQHIEHIRRGDSSQPNTHIKHNEWKRYQQIVDWVITLFYRIQFSRCVYSIRILFYVLNECSIRDCMASIRLNRLDNSGAFHFRGLVLCALLNRKWNQKSTTANQQNERIAIEYYFENVPFDSLCVFIALNPSLNSSGKLHNESYQRFSYSVSLFIVFPSEFYIIASRIVCFLHFSSLSSQAHNSHCTIVQYPI